MNVFEEILTVTRFNGVRRYISSIRSLRFGQIKVRVDIVSSVFVSLHLFLSFPPRVIRYEVSHFFEVGFFPSRESWGPHGIFVVVTVERVQNSLLAVVNFYWCIFFVVL